MVSLEKIVSLAKRRGFVFQGSEIYGGLAGIWDFGPYGAELNNNIKQYFWNKFVYGQENIFGLNASILMPERVWQASGHTDSFTDPLVECKVCHERFRADQPEVIADHEAFHKRKKETAEWSEAKKFNLLVDVGLGAVEGQKSKAYLRGEITQGVHVNFKNVVDSMHPKMPFGVAQVGKAFRNEITPRDFLFRVREFEQMELQFYVDPDDKEANKYFEHLKQFSMDWYMGLGIKSENLRFRDHALDERAHYARAACDIEYNTPFGGWKEAWGIHHRGDWDLSRHSTHSTVDLSYFNEETKEKYIPWVIETSGGVGRAFLFILFDAYTEDEVGGEARTYLRLAPHLAPVKAAVFPLLKNKPELVKKAQEVYRNLKQVIPQVAWDDNGNIGKRYRRQDEIGTPWCITIDFQTLDDGTVTIRDRDTAKQERVAITELEAYILKKL
jgi:glycyl-tRNA synthetase